MNIRQAAAEYVNHCRAAGQQESTLTITDQIANTFIKTVGEDYDTAMITDETVSDFAKHPLVTHKKSGAQKSPASINQYCCIVKSMIRWFCEQGLSEARLEIRNGAKRGRKPKGFKKEETAAPAQNTTTAEEDGEQDSKVSVNTNEPKIESPEKIECQSSSIQRHQPKDDGVPLTMFHWNTKNPGENTVIFN